MYEQHNLNCQRSGDDDRLTLMKAQCLTRYAIDNGAECKGACQMETVCHYEEVFRIHQKVGERGQDGPGQQQSLAARLALSIRRPMKPYMQKIAPSIATCTSGNQ